MKKKYWTVLGFWNFATRTVWTIASFAVKNSKILKQFILTLFFLLFLFPILSFARLDADFVDVNTSREDYPYIHDLLKRWIIDTGQVFRPDADINRAEFAKIIVLWTLWVAHDRIRWYNTFPDIDPEEWYWPYIQSARYYNFLHWYAHDWLFRPWRPISRAEAVKIVVLSSWLPELESDRLYLDLSWDEWFIKYAYTAFEHWIYEWSFYEDWRHKMIFDSQHKITRWEMATMFSKALERAEFYRKQ